MSDPPEDRIVPIRSLQGARLDERFDATLADLEVACGEVTVRNPRGFDTSTFAYVIDDDKLLVAWQEKWMKEPDPQGNRKVMRYCPGR